MTFTPDELRLLGVGGPVWLNMLRSREDRIIQKIYGEFRNGKTEFLPAIAELACVRDQIYEITSALTHNSNQREK